MWGEGDDRKYLTVNDRKILWKTEENSAIIYSVCLEANVGIVLSK